LGPSSLAGAVATSRPELVLIPSLAGLVAGLGAFRAGDELVVAAVGRTRHFFGVALGRALPLALAFPLAGWLAWWRDGKTSRAPEAIEVFGAAHALLAIAFLALALLARLIWKRRAPAIAACATAWSAFVVLDQHVSFAVVLQTAGFANLRAGRIPLWFFASQVASPVTAYKGLLVFARHGFADALEGFVLTNATLPSWLNANLFVADLAVLWIGIPLAIGWGLAARRDF
ncbi:MAG: hypothetical protein ACYDCK_10355, partial [Thermoplasmatota archaeon]